MVEASGQVTDEAPGKQYTDAWTRLGLDARILKALKKKGHGRPTVVQSRAIPLVLSGKDVVARAHTGSGAPVDSCGCTATCTLQGTRGGIWAFVGADTGPGQ